MESWKIITDFPNYQISNFGCIKTKTGKIKKNFLDCNGYFYTMFSDKKNQKKPTKKTIHRLLAEAFLPNPENKEYVTHINCDRTDNRIENLKWITKSENVIQNYHASPISGYKNIIPWGDRFNVKIIRNNKRIFCKYFDTLEQAINARDAFLNSL